MHSGSLLSLSGDRNIGISLRNVPEVRFELARILAQDVHHLVSATSGNFSDPYFDYSAFGIDQFAEKFSYAALFPNRKPGEAVYGSVDFNRFMSKSKNPQGLFLLRVSEKRTRKLKKRIEHAKNPAAMSACMMKKTTTKIAIERQYLKIRG